MNRKKQQPKVTASSRRSSPQQKSSLAIIPIVVGAALLVIALGLIVVSEARRLGTGTQAGQSSASSGTALPQPSLPVPYPDVPRIAPQEVQQELAQGQAVLIDVRDKAFYDMGHAAGALSIPEAEVEARLSELPRDKEIVLYCT